MRRRWGVVGAAAGLAVACAWSAWGAAGPGARVTRATKEDTYAQLELFASALGIVQSEYVDEQKPQELIYAAIDGMVSSLDRHSQFLRPDEYEDMRVETEGQFGGLGVEIGMKEGS